MAELVDALVSGTSVRKYVQVRVLFWAQNKNRNTFFIVLHISNTVITLGISTVFSVIFCLSAIIYRKPFAGNFQLPNYQ